MQGFGRDAGEDTEGSCQGRDGRRCGCNEDASQGPSAPGRVREDGRHQPGRDLQVGGAFQIGHAKLAAPDK